MAFYTFRYEKALPALLQKIGEIHDSNHIGTLIFACSAFDCSDSVYGFCRLICTKNYEAGSSAISVLKQMKGPFKKRNLKGSRKILKDHLQKENNNKMLIISALKLVRQFWKEAETVS